MIGVPLGAGAGRIACSFRPPGLAEGLTLALASAAVTTLAAVLGRLRRTAAEAAPPQERESR
ncbi:hypothetical protein [Kitasatospora sp. NPDC047058]|uniref:hypothetical protein n=1 Tax=Kitasatospora sp. NPDC047058 TaxID=3155620 RepID=UPI0033F93D75